MQHSPNGVSMIIYDFHTHSTASDGTLSPHDLVRRAHEKNVAVLALTDHDTIDGLEEAQATADSLGVSLVSGVELSVTWEKQVVHIIGLGIDPAQATLRAGLVQLREKRHERACLIAERLEKSGLPDVYAGAHKYARNGNVTRRHFAQYIVEIGLADTIRKVFERYMRPGKTGYVSMEWTTLVEAVKWITEAGGVAVIAHPHRYKMTATTLRRLLDSFKQCGGHGIEVVYGSGGHDAMQSSSALAKRYGLRGSVGSDFHEPGQPGIELGRLPPLPDGVLPIWDLISIPSISIPS